MYQYVPHQRVLWQAGAAGRRCWQWQGLSAGIMRRPWARMVHSLHMLWRRRNRGAL
jgi:hypothetical protein